MTDDKKKSERGAALIFALSMLAIFGVIGVAYVDYMNLNLVESDLALRKARARDLAASGIEIAASGLRQEVLSPNMIVTRGTPVTYELSTYQGIAHGEGGIVAEPMNMTRVARATITVYDESARVNLNHAPASALQKILGVDGDTARTIAASVPRGTQGPDPRWFIAVDELLGRGLLTKAQYALVVPQALTTLSVADHANPAGHFNVNGADVSALAAMLNITQDQAAQVKEKGPYATLEALGQSVASVTGGAPETVTSDPLLGLKSRCFRIVSEGYYARAANQAIYDAATTPEDKEAALTNRTKSRVEAVLLFQDDGSYEVIYWNAGSGDTQGESETPAAETPTAETPAADAPPAEEAPEVPVVS